MTRVVVLHRTSIAAAAAVLALGLAGCSSDDGAADTPEGGASDAPAAALPAGVDADDASFLTQMVPHHAQALTLVDLAQTRAASPAVLAAADRIAAGQGPEILEMAAWLDARGLPVPDESDLAEMTEAVSGDSATGHEGHGMEGMEGMEGMGAMPGMLGSDDLDALAAAEGVDFDRLFLTDMIRHHEGAVTMAEAVLADGSDQRVNEIATEISAGQTAEIERLEVLLDRL
ncbi:DUF305 domain-containing protein [Nocardioides sp. Leaf285]|uniref:DUF305 domain-containing protein n=1 Tax=Nocardioides sp. Leaf285 TaxID=1736322 RepID=UPI000702DEE0|nr:DUF305 domain-containing protein [Nocardioides sp. Leaf285]KQP64352.1 hypothetical protein ASF47_10210 [Nocardioides sp. Leaf285]